MIYSTTGGKLAFHSCICTSFEKKSGCLLRTAVFKNQNKISEHVYIVRRWIKVLLAQIFACMHQNTRLSDLLQDWMIWSSFYPRIISLLSQEDSKLYFKIPKINMLIVTNSPILESNSSFTGSSWISAMILPSPANNRPRTTHKYSLTNFLQI